MCIVSDKIKFCSCTKRSVHELDNYWLLYRFNKDKNDILIGEPILPASLTDNHYEVNCITLASRLHEADAFDMPVNFKDKDQFTIVFNNLFDEKRSVYHFKFTKGKWVSIEVDPFELMGRYDEDAFGKLQQ